MNKSVLLILLVAVAAAEGRARGAKLGHRRTRQQALWGRPREDPLGQTPAVVQPGYSQPQGSGSPDNAAPSPAPAPAPAPVYPSGGQSTGASQAGYPSGGSQPQTPIVVPGNISPASIPKCQYPGFFATPGSCVNFYRCVDWTGTGAYYSVFQFNCPPGTIFDDDLDICSHIAWVVPKRRECESMLSSSLVPIGSGPPAPGAGGVGAPGSGYGPGVGVIPQPPVQPPLAPGPIYPQPGGSVQPVSPGSGDDSNAPPRPFTLQCYSGEAYRRHPLYCNRYYRCQWDGSDWVFPMLTCPKGLIFDEAAQSCADPATIARCPGQIAPEPTPEGSDVTDSTTVTDTTPTEDSSTTPMVDPSSLYDCPSKGYYPFEGDCIRFYKCVELDSGFLKGLLYKCPEQYGYSEEKERCDKEERLPTCTKTTTPAHLRTAPARQLTVDDLEWFFNE